MNVITVKKIITKAYLVLLYYCIEYLIIIKKPQVPNSNRIIILTDDPNIPAQNEKMKLSIAISLWLVE